jgi:hypothetical protein
VRREMSGPVEGRVKPLRWSVLYSLAFRLPSTIFHYERDGKESMVTEAEIRATAKRLCFRACIDCESADECDPADEWLKEARIVLEADGPDRPALP